MRQCRANDTMPGRLLYWVAPEALKHVLPRADQLQRAVERGEYGEAARLLEAVQQLAAHFASFSSVPKARAPRCAGCMRCLAPYHADALASRQRTIPA